MGNVLAEPRRVKESHDGSFAGNYFYGVSDMQGWRLTMEDAYVVASHISSSAFATPKNKGNSNTSANAAGTTASNNAVGVSDVEIEDVHFVGVFDGHGGNEVSKFCAAHFHKEIIHLESFKTKNFAVALRECFHRMDDMLQLPEHEQEIQDYKRDMITEEFDLISSIIIKKSHNGEDLKKGFELQQMSDVLNLANIYNVQLKIEEQLVAALENLNEDQGNQHNQNGNNAVMPGNAPPTTQSQEQNAMDITKGEEKMEGDEKHDDNNTNLDKNGIKPVEADVKTMNVGHEKTISEASSSADGALKSKPMKPIAPKSPLPVAPTLPKQPTLPAGLTQANEAASSEGREARGKTKHKTKHRHRTGTKHKTGSKGKPANQLQEDGTFHDESFESSHPVHENEKQNAMKVIRENNSAKSATTVDNNTYEERTKSKSDAKRATFFMDMDAAESTSKVKQKSSFSSVPPGLSGNTMLTNRKTPAPPGLGWTIESVISDPVTVGEVLAIGLDEAAEALALADETENNSKKERSSSVSSSASEIAIAATRPKPPSELIPRIRSSMRMNRDSFTGNKSISQLSGGGSPKGLNFEINEEFRKFQEEELEREREQLIAAGAKLPPKRASFYDSSNPNLNPDGANNASKNASGFLKSASSGSISIAVEGKPQNTSQSNLKIAASTDDAIDSKAESVDTNEKGSINETNTTGSTSSISKAKSKDSSASTASGATSSTKVTSKSGIRQSASRLARLGRSTSNNKNGVKKRTKTKKTKVKSKNKAKTKTKRATKDKKGTPVLGLFRRSGTHEKPPSTTATNEDEEADGDSTFEGEEAVPDEEVANVQTTESNKDVSNAKTEVDTKAIEVTNNDNKQDSKNSVKYQVDEENISANASGNAEFVAPQVGYNSMVNGIVKVFATAAGCTAVAALLHKKQLYVANVGDSRAILCRDGVAIPLSEDHKPTMPKERARITAAGGVVNAQGRINSDLNLSRSVGDLRYKMNPKLSKAEQIVTAEADVKEFTLRDNDQFMVFACDGVWDVMTNQAVVDFVLKKFTNGETKISKVVEDLLDNCLSPNLYTTNGLGGDNMTCILIVLRPIEELNSYKMSSKFTKAVRKIFRSKDVVRHN